MAAATTTAALIFSHPTLPTPRLFSTPNSRPNPPKPRAAASSSSTATPSRKRASASSAAAEERIFFDGGPHYGDLVANLLLGFTLLWLPLTLAAIPRAFFLRYRFTDRRVTVLSGLTGQDRSDFPYDSVRDVKVVPRFVGEWGDIVITLKDGTAVDLRSVPRFREVADYCLSMAGLKGTGQEEEETVSKPRGF
ncbi:hypothetical protein QJS10_CPB12g01172 [Acorus calamus]|uniref:YdbS-like PH domain-containing protein n=1 Tax=Acorus calamus TaxID=4465 RepID=A0AAV9DMQ0_ACOCL|nr:hypothetical protein QJS10_CPB12g01172 [Acorus calamus]